MKNLDKYMKINYLLLFYAYQKLFFHVTNADPNLKTTHWWGEKMQRIKAKKEKRKEQF